jgi:outer membrane lipopolysaccharide assembly protein LptE/RlpB
MVLKKYYLCCLLIAGVFLLSGCGYTLVGRGSLPGHISTVAIPIFENTTLEQGVEDVLTQTIIDVYIRGGRVQLVQEAQADAILLGTITSYSSDEVVTYNDQNDAASYRLAVSIDVTMRDLVNDETLWEVEKLTEDEDFLGGPDVDPAQERENERQALDQLAKELAERVFALSTEGF